MTACPNCGTLNPDGVCGRCGSQLPTPDNKIIMIVIAVVVIVIVAIIVAAIVSYVLVIGGGGPYMQTPIGHISSKIVESPTEARITFITFSPALNPTDARVFLDTSSGTSISYSFSAQPDSQYTDMIATQGSAVYTDYNYLDNRISSGDNFLMSGLTPG